MQYARRGPSSSIHAPHGGDTADARVYAPTLHHIDRFVCRATRGRGMFSTALARLPVILLTTRGAKSGRLLTVPVIGLPAGDDLVVIASNWGGQRHPGWYHNLVAHPEATVTVDGQRWTVQAREATGVERERLWQLGLAVYPGWSGYERRASPRRIPVMVLEPETIVLPDPERH